MKDTVFHLFTVFSFVSNSLAQLFADDIKATAKGLRISYQKTSPEYIQCLLGLPQG